MDEETKARLEELDKRFSSLEKRLDDIKWYFGGVTALFTIGFSVFTLVSSWNYGTERASLRDFQNELRAEVGKVAPPPELQILGVDGNPLSGEEVPVKFQTNPDGTKDILITPVLRNSGGSATGPMYIKLYSNDPLRWQDQSTDERPKFKYEYYIDAKSLNLDELPALYSSEYTFHLRMENDIPPGKYPLLMKVYYGKAKVAQAQFNILVPST